MERPKKAAGKAVWVQYADHLQEACQALTDDRTELEMKEALLTSQLAALRGQHEQLARRFHAAVSQR